MADLDRLFRKMVEERASDIHLNSNSIPMWRIDGEIIPIEGEKELSSYEVMQMLEEIMPQMNFKEFKEIRDTDFAYELEGSGRFRCNVFMDMKGPGGVFRVIPSKILTAEDLNLPPAILDMCFLSKGLVVVTGPTGSGKSTTLCAMIDYINRHRSEHIITIEDPIEFVHQNKKCLINQREVKVHTSSFKRALTAALREDPDIVLVGEMRDLETIEIAIETAETGHLVFGTLHTSTAASTVERIIQQFPEGKQAQIRQMLAGSLKGVVAQTLLKKKEGKGRVAALEVLVGNSAISNLIREGKTFQIASSMQTGKNQGMVLMNDALFDFVKKGVVSAEEAYIKSIDKIELQQKFQQENIKFSVDSLRSGAEAKPAEQNQEEMGFRARKTLNQ
jgi:twitching motility protein PilT